ncbi:MAG: winged helix DNA-binding protein [Candidatus Heimdallarchaeota archaeon]|nr:winged helix DNA-binding protein [Candidatus Heimdallarchaeota archaeon]
MPRHHSFHRPHHFPPPPRMPFGREMIKELRELVFLWTIAEESEGITGYDLQKNYQAKQTNVYRTLNEMTEAGYITFKETTVKGRAQKLYSISPKGQKYLNYLRRKWTTRISFLTDVVPPEGRFFPPRQKHRQKHILHEIDQLETQDQLLDYLDTLHKHYQRRIKRLEKHSQNIQKIMQELENVIGEITQLSDFSQEKAKTIIKKMFENI